MAFDTNDEAIAIANETVYGLTAAVFTRFAASTPGSSPTSCATGRFT